MDDEAAVPFTGMVVLTNCDASKRTLIILRAGGRASRPVKSGSPKLTEDLC